MLFAIIGAAAAVLLCIFCVAGYFLFVKKPDASKSRDAAAEMTSARSEYGRVDLETPTYDQSSFSLIE